MCCLQVLCQVPGCLNMPSLEVTVEYREAFVKAEQTFLYQLIYDPRQRKLLPLTPYPNNLDPSLMPFAGHYMDENVAFQLALGNLDADTLKELDTYNPDTVVAKRNASFLTKHVSIWSKNFVIQQDSSSFSIESESAKTISVVCKHTTARIEYSIPKTAEQVSDVSDKELTRQYAKTPPSSPVVGQKRKRTDENCSPSQNQARRSIGSAHRSKSAIQDLEDEKLFNGVPPVLDPFAEPMVSSQKSCSGDFDATPRKSNPFVKLKTPSSNDTNKTSPCTSPATSHINALKTVSQLRKVDANGQEVVTSTYFQSENFTITDELKMEVGRHSHLAIPIKSNEAASQPFKQHVVGPKSLSSQTEVLL